MSYDAEGGRYTCPYIVNFYLFDSISRGSSILFFLAPGVKLASEWTPEFVSNSRGLAPRTRVVDWQS